MRSVTSLGQGARARRGGRSKRSSSAAASRTAPQATTSRASRRSAPGCRSRRRASPSTATATPGFRPIVQAAHIVLHEGVDAAIGGGVESITMMERDKSPNPWVLEHVPGIYMAMGDTAEVVAKRYGVTRQAQDEYSLVEPAADRQGAAGRVLQGRDRTHAGAPRHSRQEDRREGRRRGRAAWIATSATVRTRRSRAWRSCRRSSTEERPGQRHGRQLVAAVGRRVGHARDVERSREGARASRRCSSTAATPSPAASRTRWASARCSPCRSCSSATV